MLVFADRVFNVLKSLGVLGQWKVSTSFERKSLYLFASLSGSGFPGFRLRKLLYLFASWGERNGFELEGNYCVSTLKLLVKVCLPKFGATRCVKSVKCCYY